MMVLRMVTVTIDVVDIRTHTAVLQDIEVNYRAVVDTELSGVRLKQQLFRPFEANLEEALKQHPKGHRIVANRANYGIAVLDLQASNLH